MTTNNAPDMPTRALSQRGPGTLTSVARSSVALVGPTAFECLTGWKINPVECAGLSRPAVARLIAKAFPRPAPVGAPVAAAEPVSDRVEEALGYLTENATRQGQRRAQRLLDKSNA